ncbi:MAG: Re/Si-specific NAD(P)(+) transhydrogenase subunit alpha [Bacteroidales bacterium]|nr:Re/Si-specific NAD(P)(+) transhydrogenase subunit alpha [Bacteroidales bacterium]
MIIGILKEKAPEKRVVLTPEIIKLLVNLGTQVFIEKGAGDAAYYYDSDYKNSGAETKDAKTILDQSDILLKVNSFSPEEIKSLKKGQVVLGTLQPFTDSGAVKELVKKQLTSFSMELVPRISRAQSMDILSSQATVAGYKAVLDAAFHLPRFFPMFMSAAGTIKPAKVLILGAGVAGLQALAISRKLGSVVEVFDVRSAVKEEVKSLGGKFVEVEGAAEDAAAGGYAVEQSEEYKKKQGELIQSHALKSDVVICTAQIPGKKAPVLVKKATVEGMKAGSVIVDLAASTGGNCELTQNAKIIVHNKVTIIGNSDYPSDMPGDASAMFAKNVFNFLKLMISEKGELNLNFEDEIIKGTCLTHNGEIMNERVKNTIK